MEKIKNNPKIQLKSGKISRFIVLLSLLITSLSVSSCSIIGGIFKAGMGFGIFIVVAIIVIIVFLIVKFGKSKN